MNRRMVNRQLIYLFFSSFVILFVGMGLFPLLPLYAAQFGAGSGVIGLYFALMYIANAAGPMLTGWLADRLTRRGALIAAGVLGVPALGLLGQAAAFWQVILLTAIVWFAGGIDLALISIFTGLYADSDSRGKSFSVMALSTPLGALIGGTTIGQLVAWQGYPFMFTVLGLLWAALPLLGLLGLQDPDYKDEDEASARPVVKNGAGTAHCATSFYLFLLVALLGAIAASIGRLGTSLSMQALDFSASAVASTATVSGLATIPAILLIGVISDRLGRQRALTLSYLLAGSGALVLSMATELWHFWLAATILLIGSSAKDALGLALATDLLEPEQLNRGMSQFNAVHAASGAMSFGSTGFMLQYIGAMALFLISSGLAVAAALALDRLPHQRQPKSRELVTEPVNLDNKLNPCLQAGA